MSTTDNHRHALAPVLLRTLLNLTSMLLLATAIGELILVPASAQSTPDTKAASILGTVVDSNNDTIPNATVVLQDPAGDPVTVVTKDNGSFAFQGVTP